MTLKLFLRELRAGDGDTLPVSVRSESFPSPADIADIVLRFGMAVKRGMQRKLGRRRFCYRLEGNGKLPCCHGYRGGSELAVTEGGNSEDLASV